MIKESAMEKWFKFEIAKLNSGIVTKKKALKELAREKNPQTVAKDGSIYYFNKDSLLKLEKELPENMHSIRLPISFYFSFDVKGSVYVAEKKSLSVLKQLGEVPKDVEFVDGRYWISKVLATDLMKRRPSIIQFVRY
ncbi:MAG: DUF61 family protein [Thermoplasmata archaeon]|nr:MAG: DUF61 family protein [Thermoplasmata archaeon]